MDQTGGDRRTGGGGRTWLVALALFWLTLLVFLPALGNGFVNYDDPDYVTENAVVRRGLNLEGARWAMSAGVASNWHPLTWMSHMADVSLFGHGPRGHHATSVVLHALNAALAFASLRALTGRLWLAAVCAALFALHPLRVESVAWVSERKDVLSGAFFFGCLWAYARYVGAGSAGSGRWRWYAAAILMLALGLMAKPMLVTVPFLLLVLDFWPLRRQANATWARLVAEKAPFLALAVTSSVVTFLVQREGGSVTMALSLADRAGNAVIAVVRYLGVVAWPSGLGVLYPHPGQWHPGLVGGAAVLVLLITGMALWQARRRPWLLTGWLWFVGMLVPVLGLVQVGLQSMADRYTYLPAVGLVLALVATAAESSATVRRAGAWVAGLVLAALAVLTLAQIRVWRSSETLFDHTIAVAGKGNYLAYDNRGIARAAAGRHDEAIADYRQALAINPDYPNANNNLARELAARGQLQEALTLYRRALAVKPNLLELRNNYANALADAGAVGEAIEHYRFVLSKQPSHVNARNGHAVALAMQGRLTEAESEFQEVLRTDPENLSALSNLGNVHALAGRPQDAAGLYERVLAVQPDDARTWLNLGNARSQLGQLPEAAGMYRRAISLVPVNPDAHAALGQTLARLGQRDEAVRHLRTALRQQPNHAAAKAVLAALEGQLERK